MKKTLTFFLFFGFIVLAPSIAQGALNDATALLKPEYFMRISGNNTSGLGLLKNYEGSIVRVTNSRTGLSTEIAIMDLDSSAMLQPNTLYLNNLAAEEIGLSGRSCFVDIEVLSVSGTTVENLDFSNDDTGTDIAEDLVNDETSEMTGDSSAVDSEDGILAEYTTPYDEFEALSLSALALAGGLDERIEETPIDEEINDALSEETDSGTHNDLSDENVVGSNEDLTSDEWAEDNLTDATDHMEDAVIPQDNVVYFLEPAELRPPEDDSVLQDAHTDEVPDGYTLVEAEGMGDLAQLDEDGIYIQIGVYRSATVLSAQMSSLRAKGFPVEKTDFILNHQEHHRLVLGPFKRDEVGVAMYRLYYSGYQDVILVLLSR